MAEAARKFGTAETPLYREAPNNIEAEQALAARYAIQSIPTIALFKGGRELGRQSGLMDRAALVRWAQSILA